MVEVTLPQTTEEETESLVVFWHKSEGAKIEKGEVLVEVQTEKAVFEIEAPESGRLQEILVKRGEVASVGQILAVIAASDEQETGSTIQNTEASAAANEGESGNDIEQSFVQASPRVRRLAKELGVDLSVVKGTGPGGRPTEADVRTAAALLSEAHNESGSQRNADRAGDDSTSDQSSQGTGPRDRHYKIVELNPVRRTTSKRMMQSLQQSAQLTVTAWADVTVLQRKRKELAPEVSWNDWVMRAVVLALQEHPLLNAVWDQGRIKQFHPVHLGVAADTDFGLLVPVVKNAENLTLLQLHHNVQSLISTAREGKLSADHLTGSTFTVTNLGNYGIQFFTPIINPPEVAILGVGQIETDAVVSRGQLAERQRLPLSLTFDHRVIDGGPAARFLQTVIHKLAEPETLL